MKYSEPKALCTKKERNERGCSSWRQRQKTPSAELTRKGEANHSEADEGDPVGEVNSGKLD